MKLRSAPTLALPAALLLAACSQDASAPVETESDIKGDIDAASTDANDRSLADAATTGPTRQADVVPERFRGVWDHVEGNCDPASELRMEIGETAIGFYESRGQVTNIELDGQNSMVLELAMEGEGERWTMTRRFTLESSGRLVPSATDSEEEFEPMPLKRCPSGGSP
jgi:hypothetical protein